MSQALTPGGFWPVASQSQQSCITVAVSYIAKPSQCFAVKSKYFTPARYISAIHIAASYCFGFHEAACP